MVKVPKHGWTIKMDSSYGYLLPRRKPKRKKSQRGESVWTVSGGLPTLGKGHR